MKLAISRLLAIGNESIEVLDSVPYATAVVAMVPLFLIGTISVQLPDHEVWVQADEADPETKLFLSFVKDPSLVTAKSILGVHYIYRYSIPNGLIYDQTGYYFCRNSLQMTINALS